MRNQSTSSDVVVVGAGLAGLTAATIIARSGRRVRIIERSDDVGGLARSAVKDGFVLNAGAHALARGGHAERVLTGLGVRISGRSPSAAGRMLIGERCAVLPTGPGSLLRTRGLSARGKIELVRVLARLPKLDPAAHAEMTVDAWLDGLAVSSPARDLVAALVRLATYVHQPDQLSADVAIIQLQRGMSDGVLYLDHGWQQIVDQLRAPLADRIVVRETVDELPDAPAVVVAVGGPEATGRLLDRTWDGGPPARASCLDLGLTRRPAHDLVLGVDAPLYFSNHSAAARLAPDDRHLASLLQYLGVDDEPDVATLRGFAIRAGIDDDDIVMSRRLHRMTTVASIPTACRGGLSGRPRATDTGHPGVSMAGDWIGPDGFLVDAVVASAVAAAEAAIAATEAVPHR